MKRFFSVMMLGLALCTASAHAELNSSVAADDQQAFWEAGAYYSTRGSVQAVCGYPQPVYQYVCGYYGCGNVVVGCYQDCQRARWRSYYGTEYGYVNINGSWQYVTQTRTWYYFDWVAYRANASCY